MLLSLIPFTFKNASFKDFKSKFQLDELQIKNHEEGISAIATHVAEYGPYTAFIILMGTGPFEPFTPDFFSPLLPSCRLVVSASAGYNEFPVHWLTEQKVWFCNTIHSVSEPTADMALFLTLAVIRDATAIEKSAREGKWKDNHVYCTDPTGPTLGIIGMGAVGKHLARKAVLFNLNVQYHNRKPLDPEEGAKYPATYCDTLEELLRTSDVISVNCPLNASTRHLISHKEFAMMKDGVFLVNTARGAIVKEEALIEALESGKVARAGLDVFKNEPNINEYFRKSERCTLQPHLGGLTKRAIEDSEGECLENITTYFET